MPRPATSSALLPQPWRDPAPRGDGLDPLGERLARAGAVHALQPLFHPVQVHRVPGPAYVLRARHDLAVHPGRHRPAVRARRRALAAGDRPHLHRAARPRIRVGHPQPRNAEQRGRRIVEHDARGSLFILKSLEDPKILEAAGFLVLTSRRPAVILHAEQPARHHAQRSGSSRIPVKFEDPLTLARRIQRHTSG